MPQGGMKYSQAQRQVDKQNQRQIIKDIFNSQSPSPRTHTHRTHTQALVICVLAFTGFQAHKCREQAASTKVPYVCVYMCACVAYACASARKYVLMTLFLLSHTIAPITDNEFCNKFLMMFSTANLN